MKKLFTFCVAATMAITLSAQMTLSKGDMVAGLTYNSAYENESITDDLALTIGYAVSDELTIMATRDENTAGEDASINLGVRYFYNGFYGQLNMLDVQDATEADEDATISVGKMFSLEWVDGLYMDPSITLSRDGEDNTDTSFGVTLGMKF
tara:strand:- start:203 stop:655 length:453 start_codon:yes stop_codon:yes gene_type:complete